MAVGVLVVFVDSDPVEANLGSVFELVEVFVVDAMPLNGVIEARVDVNPDRAVGFTEIVRQMRPRHQVEPMELHGLRPSSSLLVVRIHGAGSGDPGSRRLSRFFVREAARPRLRGGAGSAERLDQRRPAANRLDLVRLAAELHSLGPRRLLTLTSTKSSTVDNHRTKPRRHVPRDETPLGKPCPDLKLPHGIAKLQVATLQLDWRHPIASPHEHEVAPLAVRWDFQIIAVHIHKDSISTEFTEANRTPISATALGFARVRYASPSRLNELVHVARRSAILLPISAQVLYSCSATSS